MDSAILDLHSLFLGLADFVSTDTLAKLRLTSGAFRHHIKVTPFAIVRISYIFETIVVVCSDAVHPDLAAHYEAGHVQHAGLLSCDTLCFAGLNEEVLRAVPRKAFVSLNSVLCDHLPPALLDFLHAKLRKLVVRRRLSAPTATLPLDRLLHSLKDVIVLEFPLDEVWHDHDWAHVVLRAVQTNLVHLEKLCIQVQSRQCGQGAVNTLIRAMSSPSMQTIVLSVTDDLESIRTAVWAEIVNGFRGKLIGGVSFNKFVVKTDQLKAEIKMSQDMIYIRKPIM